MKAKDLPRAKFWTDTVALIGPQRSFYNLFYFQQEKSVYDTTSSPHDAYNICWESWIGKFG